MSRPRKVGLPPDEQPVDQPVLAANDPFPGADAGPTPDYDTPSASPNGEPTTDSAPRRKRPPVTYTMIGTSLETGEREIIQELRNAYQLRKYWAVAANMARRIWRDFRVIQTRDVTDRLVAAGKVVL